jgi:hypothetical protein
VPEHRNEEGNLQASQAEGSHGHVEGKAQDAAQAPGPAEGHEGPEEVTMVAETCQFPSSSNLASASYEPDVEDLTIEFQSGDSYVYRNVPVSVYRGLCQASSAGSYFHRQIKGRYMYEML